MEKINLKIQKKEIKHDKRSQRRIVRWQSNSHIGFLNKKSHTVNALTIQIR